MIVSARSRGPLFLAAALLAALLAVVTLFFGRSVEQGKFAEAYSTWRATPDGAKAALLILEGLGYRVERHAEKMMALDGVDLLFILEPVRGLEEGEVDALKDFIERGGVLVFASRIASPLHEALGTTPAGLAEAPDPMPALAAWTKAHPNRMPPLRLMAGQPEAPTATAGTPVEAVPALPSPFSVGVDTIEASAHTGRLDLHGAVPIFRRKGAGAVEVASTRLGHGAALVLADPSVFSNRAIGQAGNASFLAAIAREVARTTAPRKPVVAFDEYHHGFDADRGIVGYLGRRSVAPALVQAALALLLFTLALSSRRGRPPILEEEAPPRSREHVRAMAEIYAKARLRRYCVDRLYVSLVRDVESALGLVRTVSPEGAAKVEPGTKAKAEAKRLEAVAEALRRRGVKAFRGLEKITRRERELRAFGERDMPEGALLLFAREVARFESDCRDALGRRFGEV